LSKKIKTVYDADPTAGDDETTNWLFPSDDNNNTPVTLDKTQLSDAVATVGAVRDIDERVSALETSTPLPDPGTTAYWQVTLQPNKLYADVLVIDYTGEAWIIVKDNDTEPTDDSVGSTPPTGFTPGLWENTYNLLTWSSGTLYFYQWTESGGITEKLDQAGDSGIVVSPVDTLGPVFAADALVNLSSELSALDQETKIKFSLAPGVDPSPGSGVVGQPYDLNDNADDSAFVIGVTADLPTTITVGPNFNIDLYGTVDDVVGNSGQSNVVAFQTVAAVTGGEANFSQATPYEQDDDSSPLVVTLTNTDAVGSPTVTVSTREYTGTNAVAGTRNTFLTSATAGGSGVDDATDVITTEANHGWTNDGTPIVVSWKDDSNPPVVNATDVGLNDHETYFGRFSTHGLDELSLFDTAAHAVDTASASGRVDLTATGSDTQSLFNGNFEPKSSELVTFSSGTATVNIELVTRALGSNNMFGLEIDFGSESAGTVGAIPSCLCLINSSAVAGVGSIQADFDGTDYMYVLENNDFDLDRASQSGTIESFNEATGITAASDNSILLTQLTDKWGDFETLDDDAPFRQYNINFASADQLFLSARVRAVDLAQRNEVHFNYEEAAGPGGYTTGASMLLGLRVMTKTDGAAAPEGPWIGQDFVWVTDNKEETRLQFTPAAGEKTFEIWGNEPNVPVDKVVLHTNAAYDPGTVGLPGEGALDENYGPPKSSRSTTAVEDNPLNPAVPLSPLPSDETTPVLFPDNGSAGVSPSTIFIVTLPGFTGLESHSFDVSTNGVLISGSTVVVGSQVTFTPAVELNQGTVAVPSTYDTNATGFGYDNAGTPMKYDTTGVWSITVTSSDSTDLINITFDEQQWAAAGLVNLQDATPSDTLTVLSTAEISPPGSPPQVMLDQFRIWKDFIHQAEGENNYVRSANRAAIVPAPLGRGGNALKLFHLRGDNVGGPNWRCDLEDDSSGDWKTDVYTEADHVTADRDYRGWTTHPGYEELYYSYDYYLDPLYTTVPLQKFHEWMTNWMLWSDHDDTTDPFLGVFGMNAFRNWFRAVDPDGAQLPLTLGTAFYDGSRTQGIDYWSLDGLDPTNGSIGIGERQTDEVGRWITIEVGLKLNTADDPPGIGAMTEAQLWGDSPPSGALNDGWLRVWMTDPVKGWQGKLLQDINHIWRRHNRLYLNGWMIRDHMNNTSSNPTDWTPTDNRAAYIKNIKVSKTRAVTPVLGATYFKYPLTSDLEPTTEWRPMIETAANVSASATGIAMGTLVNQLCTQQDPSTSTWTQIASCPWSDDATYGLKLINNGGGAQQGAKLASQYTVTAAGVDLILSMVVTIDDSEDFRIQAYNSVTANEEFGYTIAVDVDEPKRPATFTPMGGGEDGYKIIYEGNDKYRINIYGHTVNTSGDLSIDVHCDRNNASKSLWIDEVDLYTGTSWQGHTASRGLSSFKVANHGLSPNSFAGEMHLQVDIIPETGVDQRILWCGPDASNGVGLYITEGSFTFRKRDAGVDTDATVDMSFYPGMVLQTFFRKTTSQMELWMSGIQVATNTDPAAGTSAVIGTYYELDASNCQVKELNLYNEV